MSRRRTFAWLLLVALLVPILAACGGTSETGTTAASEAAPSVQAPEVAPEVEVTPLAEASAEASMAASAEASPMASEPATDATAAGATGDYSAWVGATASVENAPPVQNAEEIKAMGGGPLKIMMGTRNDFDNALVERFAQDTGIDVEIVPLPESATEAYSNYLRFFQAGSADLDVVQIDVIWPGAFAQHLTPLGDALGDEVNAFYPGIIENNTVDGQLVAIPWFGDFGLLYYRTDMLEKYGFSAPPKTWEELEEQAKTIMDGEKASNSEFFGFVFQGNAYEGLTCDMLEWMASTTGSNFLEDGQPKIDDPAFVDLMTRVQGWVGTIAPRGVTTYKEEEARAVFQGGNAAFMRNWPYAYALGNADDSPIKDKFDVAPLPAAEGQSNVGTVGGWQLAVPKYSQHQEAAIELARYMTSPDVQAYRAITGSQVPTRTAIADNATVQEAMPFLTADVERVARPSSELRDRYNEGSTIIFQAGNQILNGQDPAQQLQQASQRLQRLAR